MENFQYSVQLSDQDWAEFSATAEECGLLQAGLASGDEPLSSDIDQGDSSGSSPPGPRSLLGGSGWRGFEEEDQAAAQQLVSRSWQEPILAQGAGQQMPSTSAWSEARPSLSPGAISPGQSAPLQGPGPPRDEMQRLLQGPAPRDPAPRPPGESPPSPGSPGRSTLPQRPPGSPGAQQRSPSRKKRRAAGAKGGGRSSAAGSAPSPLGSPVLAEARPKGGLGPAGSRGKDLSAGVGEQTAGAGQDERGPESAGVPEQVAQPRPGPDLSTPVPTTEQGTGLLRMTPGAELHTVSTPARGPCPDFSTAKSDMAPSAPACKLCPDTVPSTPACKLCPDTVPSTPACKLCPDTVPSTPACKPRPDTAPSTPASELRPDTAPSTPASELRPDTAPSIPASELRPDTTLSTPASELRPDTALSTPACKPRPDTALSTPASELRPDTAPSTPACKPRPDTALSTPACKPRPDTALSTPASELRPDTALSTPASELRPDTAPSIPASELRPDTALSTPACKPRPDTALSTPASELRPDTALSTPASELRPDTAPSIPASELRPDTALSTPACKPRPDTAPSTPASELRPDTAPSTPASELRPDTALSTPACKPCPDTAPSTPACKPRPDTAPSTPACKPRPDTALSTPACKLRPDTVLPTPACKPRLDEDLPLVGPEVKPEVDFSTPVSKAQSDVGVSTPAPTPLARPDTKEAKVAPLAKLDTSSVVSSGGHQEKPGGEASAGAPGRPSAEPLPASRKKKVRFSMAVPSPEEPGSEEALRPPSPAAAWPSAPRTAAGGRGGPGAWDAVAVGPRLPQPRILKHLPPPAPSTSGAPGYRSCFAVTVPEAYEFFFCDTIEEEDEDAEEEAEAGEAAAQVQWPEVCEFFFRDSRAKRSGHRGGPPLASPPEGNPVPTPVPGDPVPISIPEAYEHFLGEDKEGTLGPAALLQLQATEAPAAAPQGGEPGPPAEPSPAAAEQLDLVLRQAGEPRGALTSFTFSQNDMCLVFVAFATWAVRTSDLHAPDAWKTVLLANIGTISAIRYFRRQVGRERRSPSPSPSPSPSS